jgi:molybdopterin-guanine dinucleotide biosynthesis protein A
MNTAGIVLCGGRSARMGRPKAWLPFGAEPMLVRVVRIVRDAVGSVVVVAALDQAVPPLPPGVRLVRDEVPDRGPLGGLAAGLAALDGAADVVYLASCDAPLLRAEFVRRVVESLGFEEEGERGSEERGRKGSAGLLSPAPHSPSPPLISVPRVNGRLHPLAAAYRIGVLPAVRAALAAGRLRMTDLFDAVATRFLEVDQLADTDPTFCSLQNLNTPEEYELALRAAGLSVDG